MFIVTFFSFSAVLSVTSNASFLMRTFKTKTTLKKQFIFQDSSLATFKILTSTCSRGTSGCGNFLCPREDPLDVFKTLGMWINPQWSRAYDLKHTFVESFKFDKNRSINNSMKQEEIARASMLLFLSTKLLHIFSQWRTCIWNNLWKRRL